VEAQILLARSFSSTTGKVLPEKISECIPDLGAMASLLVGPGLPPRETKDFSYPHSTDRPVRLSVSESTLLPSKTSLSLAMAPTWGPPIPPLPEDTVKPFPRPFGLHLSSQLPKVLTLYPLIDPLRCGVPGSFHFREETWAQQPDDSHGH